MDQEDVFKALADPSRRKLLDLLFQEDGRSLSELESFLPMTRFGCMKHLKVLEEAGLVTTRKIGREKRHYLNPVPIQLVYDRWVSKYAQPWTRGLTDLKYTLEEKTMDEKPSHVFEIFIRTTPEKLWQALTEGEFTRQYYFGSSVKSSWQPGATYQYLNGDGNALLDGEVLESDPPRKLVTTFRPLWIAEARDKLSRVTWEIKQVGSTCKLSLTHDQIDPAIPLHGISEGWVQILSGLKTLLETGEPLLLENQ